METVLVTGGSGYVAGWTIRKLLEKGYTVRATVRSAPKGEAVKSMLAHTNTDTSRFSYVFAELTNADGWNEAMQGVDYVLHLASPLGGENHNDPTLIETARAGVTNVIGAALRARVKKVVMTSSGAACYPAKNETNPAVDETFWTDLNNKYLTNYMRSKAVAEKTAWELVAKQNVTKLTTILPGAILGPFMDKRHGSTDQIFQMMLKGSPSPKVIYPAVDVRDLAELHILAMESPKADGQRFIAESEDITMPQIARILRDNLGESAKKVSTMVIPDFVVELGAKFSPMMKVLLTMIGVKYRHTNAKAKNLLGWTPRPAKDTVIDAARYLIDNDIV